MRTVTFQSVLHGTARLLGMNPTRDLTTDRAATLTEYINRAITPCWQFDWFPEWMTCEQRFFRQTYTAGEFIQAGMERYHAGSDAYYQALQEQAAATQPPATYTGGQWVENSAYWAVCKVTYEAPYQEAGETLAVGDQRTDRNTGKIYQIFTAHTTVSDSVDATKAGELHQFRRTLDFELEGATPIGTVKQVCQRDPYAYPRRPGRFNHRLTGTGLLVLPGQYTPYQQSQSIPTTIWVEYRQRPPQFTSTPWAQPASGQGYDLNDLVYYQGDVYRSAIGNNEQTVDGVTNWILVAFPQILKDAVQLLAAADCINDQKQAARANDFRTQAQTELERVREQEITSQQETETAEVVTYGG